MNGLGWLFAMIFLIIAAAAMAAKISRAFSPVIINPRMDAPHPCDAPPRMVMNPKLRSWLYQQNMPKAVQNEPWLIPETELAPLVPVQAASSVL